ncbi:hypothetical protein BGZ70_003772 [Mortierella alpina]|uniref:Uncharacterized protein n=1 Tax=Mortierella alpina TaxID=64518 RepID=A0A9P6IV04_MORAP|nr:hypothetical protein BGZ70_003772 [Mortierella alpina]
MKETQVSAEFRTLLDHRIPYHRKYMIYSALCVPVTSLFTIVPVVPNIPFFYNAYRLWSHWKAYNGAKHLDVLVKSGGISFQPSDVLNLGLQHDPQFAVFFTGSHQLSKRRNVRKKHGEQDPKAPVITESSGEITPTMAPNNGAGSPTLAASAAEATRGKTHPNTLSPRIDDPMSMTDHVVHEGFITDAEIETISLAFGRPPRMSSEIKRARFQEAEKFVKALVDRSNKSKHQ